MQVDVVIPFVDGSTLAYRNLHQTWAGQPPPCQLRSLGELRYVLRSLERFAPWVHQVWLVVQSHDHLPAWLDRHQVQVALHHDFVPAELLPTFHYLPLLYYYEGIPGLAEHYIAWNDDYFLGQPCPPEHFFQADGSARPPRLDWPIPRWLGRLKRDGFTQSLLGTVQSLDEVLPGPARLHYLVPHVPLAIERRRWRQLQALFEDNPRVRQNVCSRRRLGQGAISLEDLYINWLLPPAREPGRLLSTLAGLGLNAGLRLLNRLLPGRFSIDRSIYAIYNHPDRTASQMQALQKERPRLFCINDNAYDAYEGYGHSWEVHPLSLGLLEQQLKHLFPHASRYERQDLVR